MNNSNVSFTSKIKFIDGASFFKKSDKGQYIGYFHNEPNAIKCSNFYSEGIRTCTGGGIIDAKGNALGFHYWDDKPNKTNFNNIVVRLFRWIPNADRGILIGSKDIGQYSTEQFQRFKKVFNERLKHVTIFEKHKYINSGTNYHYDLKTDTWTLSTSISPKNKHYKYVQSINDLKEAFENIKIAEGDELYINGKQIKKEDAPEIFE